MIRRSSFLRAALCSLVLCGPLAADDEASRILHVQADGSGDHATIQGAIDAAEPGTTIRIGKGRFEESLTISKPVTLEGAAWDQTRIVSTSDSNEDLSPEVMQALSRIAQELDAETQAKLREATVKVYASKPALAIRDTEDVAIRNLSLLRSEPVRQGGFVSSGAVEIEDAGVTIEGCAVLESPGTGIAAAGESHVSVRNCLIANSWGKGVAISVAEAGSFEIVDSEIRNNRYSGISIGSPSPEIRVQRCRINLTGWHGIRYDSSRPLIEGNSFQSTVVSGIYASGTTAATVRNNLFLNSGMSCWFQCGDTIEANTFVGDRHEKLKTGIAQGVQVLGASNPTIHRNIFVSCKNAVYTGDIGGDRPHSKASGTVQLVENDFWDNERNLARYDAETEGMVSVPLPEGNRDEQPQFVDEEQKDFALSPDSPFVEAGIGARDFAPVARIWPLQPEEERMAAPIMDRLFSIQPPASDQDAR